MSIKHAILGLLSWKPSTGYEMKKIFEESSAMYWSGNNNQIYKSLVQLLDEGLVTSEVRHQEALPSKKIYTITAEGLAELKSWVLSPPEAPEFRKPFLIQLAWADQLNDEELGGLLSKYENEIMLQYLGQQEKDRRGIRSPDRNPREAYLWDMISANLTASLKNELDWVRGIRRELFEKETAKREKFLYKVIRKGDGRYVELMASGTPAGTEQDALDIVALCGENDTNLLMLHYGALDEGFFRHRTGAAGVMLQKFSNYFIKAAVVIPPGAAEVEAGRGMSPETGKTDSLKVFGSREEAEAWLLG